MRENHKAANARIQARDDPGLGESPDAHSLEAALAAIVSFSTDAIYSIGPGFVVLSWSAGAERLFGYRAEEVVGMPTPTMPPEVSEQMAEVSRRVLEGGEAMEFESRRRCKDGAMLDLAMTAAPILDKSGIPTAIAMVARDITERKPTEAHQALIAASVSASADTIVSLSPELKITSWNPGAERAYGFNAVEAIGRGLDLFVIPEQLAGSEAGCRSVIETGQPVTFEEPCRRRDGTPFVTLVSVFPIRDSGGRVSAIVGIGRDITALKETERQLVAAREDALAASRAKSEFLSSMSHEIRTPMTAILGMAELLSEGELNSEQRRYIEILSNNSHALLDLINSVLDLAKVESGRLTLEHVGFDLCDVVEKAAQMLAIRAHAKRIELIVSIAADVPTALIGDSLRLRQVLINLIGNAIKFTERGEVLVSVERDCAAADPRVLKFSVRDTGIGIAAAKLPALFAVFAQADSSTARKYGGSGLGLAIVKRLVGLMQGEVRVQSEEGKGSTFSFTSPFDLQSAPAAATPWPDLAQLPILIVDDNESARTALRQMLCAHGASVVEAASYAAALIDLEQAVEVGRPQRIVLLDDRIASRGTRELAQLFAAASKGRASIVPMIHCDNLAADVSRLRSLKVETYLVKPIEAGELATVLSHVIMGKTDEVPHDDRRPSSVVEAPLLTEHPLKILFADDSADNRMLIRTYLKKTPYHLDEVENGRQAIDSFIAGAYDVVLMDIQMPEVDGYAATRAIREWEHNHGRARTPIVALTASAFSEAVRLTRAAGCDAHVAKPVNKATLLRAIYEAVQRAPVLHGGDASQP